MNILEYQTEIAAFRKEIGGEATVYTSIASFEKGASASLYPRGVSYDPAVRAVATTFDELIINLRSEWAKFSDEFDRKQTRLLAIAIIELTADQGECAEPALRGRGFSQADIDRLGEKAAEEATRLSTLGPFAIVKTIGRNAPIGLCAAE